MRGCGWARDPRVHQVEEVGVGVALIRRRSAMVWAYAEEDPKLTVITVVGKVACSRMVHCNGSAKRRASAPMS